MGNASGKKESDNVYTSEELRFLETAYRNASGGALEKLTSDRLVESWSQTIERSLAESTAQFLFIPQKPGQQCINIPLKKFGEPYYIMERGSIETKMQFLLSSLNRNASDNFNIKQLEQYIHSVIKSYVHLETTSKGSSIKEWQDLGFITTERSACTFAKGLMRNLSKDLEHTMPNETLERWLHVTPQFLQLWREVFVQLYTRHGGSSSKRSLVKEIEICILPQLCDAPQNSHYRPIIELPHVLYINAQLPREMRHKWRFLFSSKIHGESFSTMLGKMLDKGPTLFFIEDEDQYIFGGYAPESWALRPQFAGNDSSLLYTLSPAMRCFSSTGYNDHYQYLNLNQQTMPNGLGMGGQFEYWGLWLDCMFGEGQSVESCTTYGDYVQLSKRKQFKIRNMEVWAVGDLPVKDDEEGGGEGQKRSVLDGNLEDRAMLEIAGKQMHSDGLREPGMDD
ncbi:MTOR-associated protein MEAK7 isoform X1 [Drosophila nasuta]|uniref:MTOR-associated protein MEAK7 n=1 Tax=Drosophila albomicans TaxID=7291 RepID=A0A6P8W3K3_DROAB|nr:MTOR-associated protein MEAK7 [Drosophila albomicans]XP_060652360.1 MTOR-associated protein MEAK7 isoform X1 [Drosophila nasuta]